MAASELEQLPNIGPASAKWLEAAGLRTRQDLEACGAVDAFLKVKQAGYSPSLNLLWALEGALSDMPWEWIPADVKQQLREELQMLDN